jgi:RNA-directed DNA polymerase
MEGERQGKPASVTPGSRQAGDIRGRWPWVEAAVWTDRMLAALENGVKGGVWFSLIDKVYKPANLRAAYQRVAKNRGAAGVDHVTIEDFGKRLDDNLTGLHERLREDRFHPQPIRRKLIDKPGTREKRPLGIPTVRDRVIQGAIRQVVEPIFEKEFAEHSYGFRPGRGCKDALRRVDGLIKAGYRQTVDIDLKAYFDTIPHGRLLDKVREHVADGRVLGLIEAYLQASILEGMREWAPEKGAPQGAVLSPLLSNIYLNDLDHLMASRGYEMTRYADDMVIQCRTLQEAEGALALVREWVVSQGLTLHPTKTMVVDVDVEGFDFLGYRFHKWYRKPREKSLKKLRDTIRRKTRRTQGKSLDMVIADVNKTYRGWFEYFKHSTKRTFRVLDAWTRMRLRSILRRNNRGKGRGRGRDHQRWPNAYFIAHGYYSLVDARAAISQPSAR